MRKSMLSALVLSGALAATTAGAQNVNPGGNSFTGGAPDRPGCPAVRIHLTRSYGNLMGIAFYANGSGVSRLEGTTDGRNFSWDQTSWKGNGPVGHVEGMIGDDGKMHVHLVGTSCSFDTVLPQYNDINGGGG